MKFILAFLMLAGGSVFAAELNGVKFEDKVTVDGKELTLNCLGLRTVNRFGLTIKVYVMGLYLPQKVTEAKAALESDPKHMRMVFVRSVDSKTVRDGWRKGFLDNCEGDCEAGRSKINEFNDLMSNMTDGKSIDISIVKNKVSVDVKAHYEKKGVIEDEAFARALPKIWLGNKPPTADLKRGLLCAK